VPVLENFVPAGPGKMVIGYSLFVIWGGLLKRTACCSKPFDFAQGSAANREPQTANRKSFATKARRHQVSPRGGGY
jgi:hypothetical protein